MEINLNKLKKIDELKGRNLELETKIISINRSPQKKESSYGQFLTIENEARGGTSPGWRKLDLQNSQSNSEMKKNSEREEENKEATRDSTRDQQDAMEEETDARLKIQKKPKQAKKNATSLNFLTGINICPNCSLIIKKSDKSVKECSKCQGIISLFFFNLIKVCIHEKCADEQKGKDLYCNPCHEKLKKLAPEPIDDEENNNKKNKDEPSNENGSEI